jgi:uncharacterized membrane protein
MAQLVSRRIAVRRGRPEPQGLESIMASMTPVGWLSVLAAVGIVVVDLRPLVESGAIGVAPWTAIAGQLAGAFADAAMMLVPAALLIGFPGVWRRNRWLYRGAVLLAGAQFARVLLDVVQAWILEALAPGSGGSIDPSTLQGLAFALLSLAIGLASVTGAWSFSDGLSDAGARPPRVLLAVVAIGLVGAMLLVYRPLLTTGLDLSKVVGWLNLVGFSMSMVLIALYGVLAVRLMAGPFLALVPPAAWVAGALGGTALLAQRILSPLGVWLSSSPEQADLVAQISLVIVLLGYVGWPLLMVAAFLGLGRGTRRRHVRAPLVRLFIVNPTD